MLALDLYEAQVCEDCRLHESIRFDPANNVLMPEVTKCPVCARMEPWMRQLHADDAEWAEKHKDAAPLKARPEDGRRITLKFLTPAEAEAEKQRRQPKGGEQRGNSPRARSPRASG